MTACVSETFIDQLILQIPEAPLHLCWTKLWKCLRCGFTTLHILLDESHVGVILLKLKDKYSILRNSISKNSIIFCLNSLDFFFRALEDKMKIPLLNIAELFCFCFCFLFIPPTDYLPAPEKIHIGKDGNWNLFCPFLSQV